MKKYSALLIIVLYTICSGQLSAQLLVNYSITHNSCFGECFGEIDLSVSGGVSPYNFIWSNGLQTESVNGLCEGTYHITITDSILSMQTLPWTYTYTGISHNFYIPAGLPQINTLPLDSGDYIGVFYSIMSGQECGGYIMWDGLANTISAWGDETLTSIKDGFGLGEAIHWKIWRHSDNMVIDMLVYYVGGPIGYTTNATSTLNAFQGNYTPPVSTNIEVLSFIIVNLSNITVAAQLSNYNGYGVSAVGINDGFIDLAVTGGVSPYTYAWSNGASSEDQINLASGSYSISITDSIGCSSNNIYNISSPASSLQITAIVSDYSGYGVSSLGANDGYIDLEVNGGLSPYTYQWSNGTTTQDISSLIADTYTVTVTDSSGTMIMDDYIITSPISSLSLNISTSQTNNYCFESCLAEINLAVTGGVIPYSYQWSNGSITQDINGLCAGIYTVTVTDAGTITGAMTWSYTNTGTNHTVLINSGVCFVNNLQLSAGDFIGAFFNDNGTLTCGGYGPWPGNTTAVSIWGDDSGTTVKDGFSNGETIFWKVWKTVDGAIVDMAATYTFGPVTYQPMGISSLASLTGTYNPNQGVNQEVLTFSITAMYQIILNAQISNFAGFGVSAYGASDGFIDLTVSGGIAPYTYIWSNGSSSEDLINLPAGTYILSITDSLGCSSADSYSLSSPASNLQLTAILSDYAGYGVSSYGVSDGFIDLEVSGGLSPYTYIWSNGAIAQDISILGSGVFFVTVTDSIGTTLTDNFTITSPLNTAPLAITAILTDNDCFGDCFGEIDVSVSGGTSPYSFNWSNGMNLEDITGLCNGTYTVTVSDSVASSLSMPWSYTNSYINHTLLVTGSTLINGSPLDSGDYVGVFYDLNGTLQCGGYTLWNASGSNVVTAWGDDSYSSIKDGFSAGESISWKAWRLVDGFIVDLNVIYTSGPVVYTTQGISTVASLSGSYNAGAIANNEVLSLIISSQSNITLSAQLTDYSGYGVSTYGASDGSIDLSLNGGISPYTYLWSNGQNTEDLINIPADTYDVSISDALACTASESFTLTSPGYLYIDTVIISDYSGYNVSGSNANDGFIDITVVGGSGPFYYTWSTGMMLEDLQNLIAGTYTVTVSDMGGLTISETYILAAPVAGAPLSAIVSIINIPCYGNCNGEIDLNITGGSYPYSFLWSDGSTDEDRTALCAGTYSCTITDYQATNIAIMPWTFSNTGLNMNIAIPSGTVMVNGAPITNGDVLGVFYDSLGFERCAGHITWNGNTNVMVAWGDQNYSNPEGFALNELIKWKLWRAIDGYVVNMQASYVPGSQGTGFYHNNGLAALTNLVGSYNPAGTQLTAQYSYQVLTLDSFYLDTALTLADPAFPYSGAIDLTPVNGTPPIDVSTNVGILNLSTLNAGYYSITATDSAGCIAITDVYLEQSYELDPIVVTPMISNPTCAGACNGEISISLSGGLAPYYHQWNGYGASDTISNLCEGQYLLSCIDAYQGPFFTNWDYTQTSLTHNFTFSQIVLDGTPIPTGSSVPQEFKVGAFYRDNGLLRCAGSFNNIIVPGAVPVIAYADNPITPIKDGFTPGDSIYWYYRYVSSAGAVFQGRLNASYSSSGNNSGIFTIGASSFVPFLSSPAFIEYSFLVEAPDSIQATYVLSDYTGFNTSAYGISDGSIDLTVSGGTSPYVYMWSDGSTTEDRINVAAGSYQITITDTNLCDSILYNFTLTSPPPAPITFVDTVFQTSCYTLCDGGVEMMVSGGYTPYSFEWSNGDTTAISNNLCAGLYELSVSSDTSLFIFQFEVLEPDSLMLDFIITHLSTNSATFGAIDLSVSGGTAPYAYLWSTGSNLEDVSPADLGLHEVIVTDAHGCEVSGETIILLMNSSIPWIYASTSVIHQIEVPFSANLQLNGLALEPFDLIGVFYDSAGVEKCGGLTVWQQINTKIIAHGDNLASSMADGFTIGEVFNWKVFDQSASMAYNVLPDYSNTYADDSLFISGGQSGINSLQTLSISGTVSASTKSMLELGMMVVYEQSSQGLRAVDKSLIVDGEYMITNLKKGSYICYAIPQPNKEYGIPGYYTSRDNWQNALWIEVNGDEIGINVSLDPVLAYNTGSAQIDGAILVGDNSTYNPLVFDNEWFPAGGSKSTAARNIPVILYDEQNIPLDFRLTSEQGAFSYANLEYGTYFVRVEQAGFQTDSVEVILSADNPEVSNLLFTIDSTGITGSSELVLQSELSIYPNPTNNYIIIQGNKLNANSGMYVNIFDVNGKLLVQRESNKSKLQISMTSLASGIYHVQVTQNSCSYTAKIIKE